MKCNIPVFFGPLYSTSPFTFITRLKATESSFAVGAFPTYDHRILPQYRPLAAYLDKSTFKELQDTVKALRFLNPVAVTLCPSKLLPVDPYHNPS